MKGPVQARAVLGAVLAGGVLLRAAAPAESARGPDPGSERVADAAQSGGDGLGSEPSLADYLVYAALHNPGLEAAFHRWRAAMEQIAQARSLPAPMLTYAYFVDEVETRVGPQEHRVGLAQSFPWFGRLKLRGDVAARAADVAFQEYQVERLRLFYRVKRAYWEYYYLYRAIAITEDNIRLLRNLEKVARAKFRAGESQAGVIRAQVELGKLDDRLRTLRELRGPLAAQFNAVLNRPQDALVPWPDAPPLTGADVRLPDTFDDVEPTNPELAALDEAVAQQEANIALARKAFYPDLRVGVDYIATGDARMPGTPDSGKDPFIATIGIDLPIWPGAIHARVEEAKQRRGAAARARDDKANQLNADLRLAVYRLEDADRKINLYRDTLIPQAEQSLRITEEAYRSGAEDFLDVVDAERLLLEFQLAHERALADRAIAIAQIEQLIGKPLVAVEPDGRRIDHAD